MIDEKKDKTKPRQLTIPVLEDSDEDLFAPVIDQDFHNHFKEDDDVQLPEITGFKLKPRVE